MKQFSTILKFELKYYLKNKVFVGVTVFLVALIAVVMFFPRLSGLFGGDDGSDGAQPESYPVMFVKAENEAQTEIMKQYFAETFTDYKVEITDYTEDEIKEKILSGDAECAFVLTGETTYKYYVNNLSMYDMNMQIASEVLQSVYRVNAMINSGMSPEDAGKIMSVHFTGEVANLGKDQMENYWYTYIMIFALYMVILLYGQMVATNVATEKSSRAMEVLITSAKPTSMMFGKVVASCLAGFTQLVAVFGSAIILFNVNRSYWGDNQIINSIFNMPTELLVYMLIFFILGFFIYAFMYGAVGSTASKLEDINTSVMPITMMFIIAFIVVMFSFSSGNIDNILIKICSFIPFTSPMAMFARIAMSTVPFYEIIISIAVLIGSVLGIGVISAKIYRVGVLLYGTTPKIGSVIKTVFKSK